MGPKPPGVCVWCIMNNIDITLTTNGTGPLLVFNISGPWTSLLKTECIPNSIALWLKTLHDKARDISVRPPGPERLFSDALAAAGATADL